MVGQVTISIRVVDYIVIREVKEDTKLKISNTLKSLKRGKTVPLRDDIIKLRYEDKLSQSVIAEILGLHQTAISKFLRNYEHSKE